MRELDEVIRALRKWDSHARIILFGSRARGDYLKDSDYDLIVISDKFEGVPFTKRAVILLKLLKSEDLLLPLDILCYTREEFERKKRELGIIREALTYGIEL